MPLTLVIVQNMMLPEIDYFYRFTFPSVFVVYMTITLMVIGKTLLHGQFIGVTIKIGAGDPMTQ